MEEQKCPKGRCGASQYYRAWERIIRTEDIGLIYLSESLPNAIPSILFLKL